MTDDTTAIADALRHHVYVLALSGGIVRPVADDRLNQAVAAVEPLLARARAEGAAEERQRVVEWIRGISYEFDPADAVDLHVIAEGAERGDHLATTVEGLPRDRS